MDQRTFHGELTTQDLANALLARFNRGDLRAHQCGHGCHLMVQISTPPMRRSARLSAVGGVRQPRIRQ